MRQLRLLHAHALPTLGLLFALLISFVPAHAQQAVSGGLSATAGTSLATPDLRMPTGGVAGDAPALNADRGMGRTAPGPQLHGPVEPFAPRAAPAATLQQTATCEPMLSNPTVDSGYDWTVLTPWIYTSDGAGYFSAPDALWFQDGNDGFDETANEDFFGQDFYFAPDAESALIEIQVAYSQGSQDLVDYVFYEFYRVDANGTLIDEDGDLSDGIDPVGRGEVNEFADNEWHAVTDFVVDPAIIGPLQGQRVAFTLRGATDNLAPFEAVYFDNIQVTTCRSTTLPEGQVSGTLSGVANPSDAQLALYSLDSAGDSALVDVTTPDVTGSYIFRNLAPPEAGSAYQVWYINTDKEGRLSYWSGPLIDSFINNQAAGGDFSIADVALLGPPHYDEVAFPATFTWQTRPGQGDRYYFCLYEADTFSEVCTTQPLTGGSYTIQSAAVLQGISDFTFAYGKTYGWYVRVAGPAFDAKSFAHLGASGYSQFVSFTQQVQTQPPAPRPEPPLPSDPNPDADTWTVMFYIAGDDEQLSHPGAGARGMGDIVTGLNLLAARYPKINIVALFDLYETVQKPLPADLKGTQFCYFDPTKRRLADSCQQRGEQNTSDPATLSGFINEALQKYPAQRTMLVIMGHGSTVSGVAGDETTRKVNHAAGYALSPDQLETAFETARLNEPARKLDVLVFYACLMGSYETAALISPFADYMVASPNITTLIDINNQILSRAQANPTNPRAVTSGIVQDYDLAMSGYNQRTASRLSIAMTAYDLAQVAALKPKVENLASVLVDELRKAKDALVLDEVQTYDSSAPTLWGTPNQREDALVDLRHLAALIAAKPTLPLRLRTPAQQLRDALAAGSTIVIARVAKTGRADLVAGGDHTLSANSFGLAIYLPNNSQAGDQPTQTDSYLLHYRQTSLRTSSWIALVDATRTQLPTLPRRGNLTGSGAGAGSTLQNFVAPDLFPVASAMPASGVQLYLPLLRK